MKRARPANCDSMSRQKLSLVALHTVKRSGCRGGQQEGLESWASLLPPGLPTEVPA